MRESLVFLIILCGLVTIIDSLNILILCPTPIYSHQLPLVSLVKGLLDRGHGVTVIGQNSIPNQGENFTLVDLSSASDYFASKEDAKARVNSQRPLTKWEMIGMMPSYLKVIEGQLSSESFQRFKSEVERKNVSFDTVIIDSMFVTHLAVAAGMLTRGSKPIIGFTTTSSDLLLGQHLGSFDHLSFSPSMYSSHSDKMSIFQKIENWACHQYISWRVQSIMKDSALAFFRQYFGDATPAVVEDSWRNIGLLMMATNSLYSYPRLHGPNIIELGAMHIQEPPEALSKNVQQFCDGAEAGVIYFSMGSSVATKSLTDYVIASFVRVFAELPPEWRVLWKWESDQPLPEKSENILTQKWFQQQSVLAHPKVKVFITQGGLQSFQEAVHFGVPTVGISWFADQEMNVGKMVNAGVGLRLDSPMLTSYDLIKQTIDKIRSDDSYENNMKRYSEKTKDFTKRSVETAVFWVEYVSKLGDVSHLRPSTAHATFVEFFCLDILTVAVITTALLLYGGHGLLKL